MYIYDVHLYICMCLIIFAAIYITRIKQWSYKKVVAFAFSSKFHMQFLSSVTFAAQTTQICIVIPLN